MKIQSKFQDYYDAYQYNLGEDVFYNRNMNLRVLENEIIKEPSYLEECNDIFRKYLPNKSENTDWKSKRTHSELLFNIVFIGDKIVPYCTIYYGKFSDYLIENNVEYQNIFFLEDAHNISEMSVYRRIRNFENHLSKDYTSLFNKIREITKEPIVSFSSYNNYSGVSDLIRMKRGTTLNPSLKELGFSKIIEPHVIIQELELYIKKYNNVEKEVQFSNELKIQNAGFDKNSFRN